ncbi:hypothetical protein [Cesiribacter andamanensis]|uniref:DUF429 domain-containing protein n=1 Tax=Cesiribacter andamanensis AMV16 TaxID=1279009 RepID=M7N3B7_9BACT|nr:hypothetical protein [Cesiribacter andamanensis]EMR01757.1 hypothetical protein ADICEAN_03116 [Cesiribacter andamanensis AMV16]
MPLQLPPYPIAGLDFGSKLAGTTVLALLSPAGELRLFQSEKKKDADFFLKTLLRQFLPKKVFIDAPLSLPGVYQKLPGYEDFFYRKADRELQAMSPLFLGGLTARAIQLQHKMLPDKVQFIETYPAGWVRFFGANVQRYREKAGPSVHFSEIILDTLPFITRPFECHNWHQADALIALISGLRYENQQHSIYGNSAEGQIVI